MIIDSLEKYYSGFTGDSEITGKVKLMLFNRSWITEITNFDPNSGKPLVSDVYSILNKISNLDDKDYNTPEKWKKDRIYRIIEHINEAINYLIKRINSKITRKHVLMPVYAVKEMDSISLKWLARKSGRTIREKLSDRPYLQAVRRINSYDTVENRFFKALLKKIDYILTLREKATNESLEITGIIRRWQNSEYFELIGTPDIFIPNNVLLQDKYYRKIFYGWNQLQIIDKKIKKDFYQLRKNFMIIFYWEIIAQMNKFNDIRIIQMPVIIDYDNFRFSNEGTNFNTFADFNTFAVKGYIIKNNKFNYGEFEIILSLSDKEDKIEIKFQKKSIILNSKENKITCSEDLMFSGKFPEYKYEWIRVYAKRIVIFLLRISANEYEKNTISNEILIKYNKYIVIDLYNVKPYYIDDENKIRESTFSLLVQFFNNFLISCNNAKALEISDKKRIISVRNLFINDEKFTKNEKIDAAMKITGILKENIFTREIAYLVPDWADDFDLENIRRGINYHFKDCVSIPQSIAAVNYIFSNKNTIDKEFNENTVYLVLDRVNDIITITPVQGQLNKDLEKLIPETYGIWWERYPNIEIPIKNDSIDNHDIIDTLYAVFGKDFLLNNNNILSFYFHNKWKHLPENLQDLKENQNKVAIKKDDIFNKINEIELLNKKDIKVILLDNTINIENSEFNVKKLNARSLLHGASLLNVRQKIAEKIPLWIDHLPQLSIKNPIKEYKLIEKDEAPINPKKGERKNIKISEKFKKFKLPKNKKFIHFELIRGLGSGRQKYYAFLTSSAFPLKEDIDCDLHLTYSYGEEKPYTLQFKPKSEFLGKADFSSIEVEWLTKNELNHRIEELGGIELINPEFPEQESWEKFKHYPSKDRTKEFDIIEYSITKLKSLVNIDENITNIQINDIIFNLRLKPLRFNLSRIWNNGHSLSEPEAPAEFRETILAASMKAIFLLKHFNSNKDLCDELLYFLSCMNKDMPNEIGVNFIELTKNLEKYELQKKLNYSRMIAYAIGDASIDWQKEIIEILLSFNKQIIYPSTIFDILSVSFWRNKDLIFYLNKKQLNNLLKELKKIINKNIEYIVNNNKNRLRFYSLIKNLEVLMALLRLRTKQSKILLPEDEITIWFADKLDTIQKMIDKYNLTVKSYLEFKLEKPSEYQKTPDLLYALRLFLTGDDAADSIIIEHSDDD